jgi:endonuclease YncB( thermonuclease family)
MALSLHIPISALLFLLLYSSYADAQNLRAERSSEIAGCATEAGGASAVVEVVDGQTLRLGDGRFVRLVGLLVPVPFMGPYAFNASEKAVNLLRQVALGRKVTIRYGGRKQDRYGVHLAQVVLADDGMWLQQRLTSEGFALYAPQIDNKGCARELLAAEQEARTQQKGLWQPALFQVLSAADGAALRRSVGTFQIVEGRVDQVSTLGSRTLLTFGSGKRPGFALSVSSAAAKLFKSTGSALEDLAGATIRVRGWITLKRGPMMDVTQPEQVERVSPPRL